MISLDETQQIVYDSLIATCKEIENELSTSVNPNEPQYLQNQIEKLRTFLSHTPTLISGASTLYDTAKRQCAEQIMKSSQLLDLKANVQKMWIDGEISQFNSLFLRVESVTKKLDKSIEALVSQLSFEKEKIKNHIHSES
jgi:hypothetical protein